MVSLINHGSWSYWCCLKWRFFESLKLRKNSEHTIFDLTLESPDWDEEVVKLDDKNFDLTFALWTSWLFNAISWLVGAIFLMTLNQTPFSRNFLYNCLRFHAFSHLGIFSHSFTRPCMYVTLTFDHKKQMLLFLNSIHNKTREKGQNKTKNKTKQNKTKQNKKQNKTKQNKTKQNNNEAVKINN